MSKPSKRHQSLLIRDMASLAINRIGQASSLGHHNRPPTIYSLTSKLDPSILKWTLRDTTQMESAFRIFRDTYLESDSACKLIDQLTMAGSGVPQELFQAHLEALEEPWHDQKQPWIGDNIFTEPVVGLALDVLAEHVGNERIPPKIVQQLERAASRISGCDDLRDLVLRIDEKRWDAVKILIKTLEPICGHDDAWLNVTANPYFKCSCEQLSAIANRRLGFSGRIDMLVVSSAYLKAFEQAVGNILSACIFQELSGGVTRAPLLANDQWSNDQVITTIKAESRSLVFVIGTFDKRITVYNEQIRALRVVRALVEERIARPGSRVAIIGGGVAGVSSAIALAKSECDVTLFEKNEKLIGIQGKASHRYLHPHIFTWPSRGSTRPEAGLPYPLDWVAGNADKVAAELRSSAERAGSSMDCLRILTSAEVIGLEENTDRTVSLTFTDNLNGKQKPQIFDIAVFAIGFGSDQYIDKEFFSPGYWTPDGLDELKTGRILISGNGDGGLIDVIRASLDNFDHKKLIEQLSKDDEILKLGEEIYMVDQQARAAEKRAEDFDLFDAYMKIEIPFDTISLIETKVCKGVSVTLNHKLISPFSTTSAIINKVFVLLLLRAGVIQLVCGTIVSTEKEIEDSGSVWVTIDDQEGNQTRQQYDRVIVRHGPNASEYFNTVAGEPLSTACEPLGGIIADLGLTERLDERTDEFFN